VARFFSLHVGRLWLSSKIYSNRPNRQIRRARTAGPLVEYRSPQFLPTRVAASRTSQFLPAFPLCPNVFVVPFSRLPLKCKYGLSLFSFPPRPYRLSQVDPNWTTVRFCVMLLFFCVGPFLSSSPTHFLISLSPLHSSWPLMAPLVASLCSELWPFGAC